LTGGHWSGRLKSLAAVLTFAVLGAACSDNGGEGGSARTSPGDRETTVDSATTAPTTTAPPLYPGYRSEVYTDPANWICRADTTDVCDSGLDATSVATDGTLTVEAWTPAAEPPIDCFYVYPTVSSDPGPISDRIPAAGQEINVVVNQAARLSSACRVFAPSYRQSTLTALTGAVPRDPTARDVAYADVLDAFKQYEANDSAGRGVVLIGHSQGAGLLNRLIREEVDPSPAARDRLVAAYLAGATVRVPSGADVGGDFTNVPACRAADQVGCVLSWASFRSTAPPPPDSLFGRPRRVEGQPAPDGRALCTNPADLSGASADTRPYFLASGRQWVDPSAGTIATPFAALPGLISAKCVEAGEFDYLAITVNGDPADPRADDIGGDLTPQWGLHLQDINLLMGDIVDLVEQQAAAYAAR